MSTNNSQPHRPERQCCVAQAAAPTPTPPAPTTPAQARRAAVVERGAVVELDRATRAYHQAIDATERAAAACNFAWYDAARSTEREAAARYALAVRGAYVARSIARRSLDVEDGGQWSV